MNNDFNNNLNVTEEKNVNISNNRELRFNIIMIAIILILIAVTAFFINKSNKDAKEEKSTLAKLFEVLPKDDRLADKLAYLTPSFYFNYKDKLYYYERENGQNYLYVMDMNGRNKKLISQDDQLVFPSFYLVYKDEAYFISTEAYYFGETYKTNYKVNLNTGVVTNLENSYTYIPYLFKDGKIVSSYIDYYRIHNLDTNTIEYENTYEYNNKISTIFDYSTGDLYSITNNINADVIQVYKNKEEVGSFDAIKIKHSAITLLLASDDSLFFYTDSSFFKYDVKTGELKSSPNDITTNRRYHTVDSNNPNNVFIYNNEDCYLYMLDKDNVTLKKVFKIVGADEIARGSGATVVHKNPIIESEDKIIVPVYANTLRYKTPEDTLGTVNIYDKNTGEVTLIENVRRTTYDYENNILYLYIKKESDYYSEKIEY